MRILGVEVIPFLISAMIMISVAVVFSYHVGQDLKVGLLCGLIASALAFFIIALTEHKW